MPVYEVLCVLDPALREEDHEVAISRLSDLVTREGGEIQEVQRWGRRRLGYEVKKRREGVYVYVRASAPPAAVAEASRHLRISEAVLKHMVVRVNAPRRAAAPDPSLAAGPASAEAVAAPGAGAEE